MSGSNQSDQVLTIYNAGSRAESWLVNLVDPAFKIIVQNLGTDGLKSLRQCSANIRDRIDDNINTFKDWKFYWIDCSGLQERILGIRAMEGIQVYDLAGDQDNCDETVELLIAKHPELKTVWIGGDNTTDRGLQALLTADGLTTLCLSKTFCVTGKTLKLCPNSARHIKHLSLKKFSLSNRGLLKILKILGIQLISLDVNDSDITGRGFHVLQGKFANLELLRLRNCIRLTQQGLLEILMMCGSKLQDLDISGTFINGEGLEQLEGKFVDLTTLNLRCCDSLTDEGLFKILRMCGNKLQHLDLYDTKATGQGLDELQVKFADLKTLHLGQCPNLTDQGLLNLLTTSGNKLQYIDIAEANITGHGLNRLHGKFASLKTLNLAGSRSVTDVGFSEIINISGPQLETVWLSHTNISTEVKDRIKAERPNLTFKE